MSNTPLQVTLTCDISVANGIVTLLGGQPYNMVAPVIQSFQQQLAAQVAATAATAAAPAPASGGAQAIVTEGPSGATGASA